MSKPKPPPKPWLYTVGDFADHGWEIVADTGRIGWHRRPVYVAMCPKCKNKTEELTGPEMKLRPGGCFSCRWQRKLDSDVKFKAIHWTRRRDRYVWAIEEASAEDVKAAVLKLSVVTLSRVLRAMRADDVVKNRINGLRKYQRNQRVGRVTVLDDGSKVLKGGHLVFYTCRCDGCKGRYVWPTRHISTYEVTGCPRCRDAAKTKTKPG